MSTVTPEPDKGAIPKIYIERGASTPGDENHGDNEPIVIRVGFLAYLRTMWSLLWTALRHPTRTTYIDAATGKVLGPRVQRSQS
jgi:hypothetical protein